MADEKRKFILSKDEIVQAIQGSKNAITITYKATDIPLGEEIILETEDESTRATTKVKSITYKMAQHINMGDALDNGFATRSDFVSRLGVEAGVEAETVVTMVRF